MSEFLTPNEFVKATGICRNTVYEAIKNGSIPSIIIGKRKILIPADALERMFSAQSEKKE